MGLFRHILFAHMNVVEGVNDMFVVQRLSLVDQTKHQKN